MSSKPGFFRRLFSGTNASTNWASQSENRINEESSMSSDSSVRNNTPDATYKRPYTTNSTLSTLSGTSESSSTDKRSTREDSSLPPLAATAQLEAIPATTSLSEEIREHSASNPFLVTERAIHRPESVLAPFINGEPLIANLQAFDLNLSAPVFPTRVQADKVTAFDSSPEHKEVPTLSSSLVRDDRARESTDLQTVSPKLQEVTNKLPLTTFGPVASQSARFKLPLDTATLKKGRAENSILHASAGETVSTINDQEEETLVQVKACALYEWQDTSLHPSEYAAFLGTDSTFSKDVRNAYLDLFDFRHKSIIRALRQFCAKLYIRGETQVIDRILESFSRRWRACNSQDPYLTQSITHIIAYALITLNTDLHIANVESDLKMKRAAFTANTLHAIQSETLPGTLIDVSDMTEPTSGGLADSESTRHDGGLTIRHVPRSNSLGGSSDAGPESSPRRADIAELVTSQSIPMKKPIATSTPSAPLRRKLTLRKSPSSFLNDDKTKKQAREMYLKEILQDMYVSVKTDQIRQPDLVKFDGTEAAEAARERRRPNATDLNSVYGSSRSYSLRPGDMLSRNESTTSLDAFGKHNSMKSDPQDRDRISNESGRSGQARESWNKQGRANTTAAVPRALGFASSLSNVITREEATSGLQSPADVVESIEAAEEDDLTLHGAPFAKEGRLMYRLHDSSVTKKSRGRHWTAETFAVLSRGEIKLFDFSAKTMKSNQKLFGGGDWTQNARSLLELSLVQTVAAALPEGSYLKDRPHIWALTMPDGVVHLFHVGTDELVQEWISTANYWAARITKEPLLGAVDNAEYGWGACLDPTSQPGDEATSIQTGKGSDARSLSTRNSISNFSIMLNPDANRFDDIVRRYPGNRAVIREWRPDPTPPRESALPQDEQVQALSKFVAKLEGEVARHDARRDLLPGAFSPHHPNLARAQANFERRRQHWLSEINKYRTYIEALAHGIETAETVRSAKMDKNMRDLQPPIVRAT